MRMRPWIVVMVLLVPVAARANDHRADFCAAMSAARGSALWGTQLTLGLTSPKPSSQDLSILGDLSIHVGTHNTLTTTRVGFMGGVRWWAPGTKGHKHRAFGQVLFGGVREHAGAQSDADIALAPGVGYEFHPRGAEVHSGLAGRVQIDYVFRSGAGFPRFSAGIVYRLD